MLKPVAVITCLEDSPPSFDRRLLEAYLRTVYKVAGPPGFSFYAGRKISETAENWLSAKGCSSWAFITAWNPFSQPLSVDENRGRNCRLATDLNRKGWQNYPGFGTGPDEHWPPEESFWVLNIPPGEAVRLGKKFDQNALVWWESAQPACLWLLV